MGKRLFVFILVFLLIVQVSSYAASSDMISVLLLGTDDLGEFLITDSEEMSRSDALFIVTLQPETGAIKILSIERDYLVELPDNLGINKLGISSYFGGPDMTLATVNEMFDLSIDYYAHIDITNVIKAIDIIGGVEVNVRGDEVDEINAFIDSIKNYSELEHVTAGINLLNGPEAWAFLGVRNVDIDTVESNAARNDRQQRVLTACLDKLFEMGSVEAMKLANDVLPLVKTNLTMADIISTITVALKCDFEKVSYLRTPIGPYQKKRVDMHRGIVLENLDSEIALVHQFLFD